MNYQVWCGIGFAFLAILACVGIYGIKKGTTTAEQVEPAVKLMMALGAFALISAVASWLTIGAGLYGGDK